MQNSKPEKKVEDILNEDSDKDGIPDRVERTLRLQLAVEFLQLIQKYINALNDLFWGSVRPFLTQMFEVIEEGRLTQRAAVWAGIALNVYVLHWCFKLVQTPPTGFTGMDLAAVIAALMTPLAGLTGALMKYGDDIKITHMKKLEEPTEPKE